MTPARFPHSDTPGSQLGCQLPRAYRRLPRPSSALDAKASTMCPSQLATKLTNKTRHTHPNKRRGRHAHKIQATKMLASTIQKPNTTTPTPTPPAPPGRRHQGLCGGSEPQQHVTARRFPPKSTHHFGPPTTGEPPTGCVTP